MHKELITREHPQPRMQSDESLVVGEAATLSGSALDHSMEHDLQNAQAGPFEAAAVEAPTAEKVIVMALYDW